MPHIGPIHLARPFCQAGLAGYSDRAMRLVARRRGCPYAVTEALLDTILINGGEGLRRSVDVNEEDHPVAGQIIGSDADTMARAATLLHERGYDVIDLNFACPVKKIRNKARGGHMLIDVPRAESIVKAVRDALPPSATTTVSLRRGFDETPESRERFERIVETIFAHGYAGVRVHARTVEQKYLGRSRWDFLREVKQRWRDKTILGSGDVFCAQDVVRMLKETGVDVVWIARGAIGNPWIFQHAAVLLDAEKEALASSRQRSPSAKTQATVEARSALEAHADGAVSTVSEVVTAATTACDAPPLAIAPPSIHEQRDALAEHFSIAMEIHGEQLAGRRMRKMGIKYSRFHPRSADVKHDFINVRSLRDWNAALDRWYAADGPGVWPAPDAADEVNAEAGTCDAAAG